MLINQNTPQWTVSQLLNRIVDVDQLVSSYFVCADPLRNRVLLYHGDDLVLQLLILLDHIFATERPCLVHVHQACFNFVKFFAERHEIEVQWGLILPVGCP